MQLPAGTRVGAYEIVAPLGAGGMGEVYRARDLRLGRDVAIKALPATIAADADRIARFEREAQILASLNHPNIATIHSVLESGGATFLVLELVEGVSLAERLAGGAIPIEESLAIARQIAEALQAAHLKGIVHRDLKPGNVMLTPDGRVKVLDFGLAKIAEPAAPAAQAIDPVTPTSPTFTSPATELGVILGTAAYMAPEQARGKPVDKRADVWAFGCVLYEMLTGHRPFAGESVTEILAAVLRGEPDWSRLPNGLSPTVQRYVRTCFEKNPQDRLQDVGDMRLAIEGQFDIEPAATASTHRQASWLALAIAAFGGVLLAVIALLTVVPALRPTRRADVRRLSVMPAPGAAPYFDAAEHALSPDGRFLVYRSGTSPADAQLWLRALDAVAPRALEGTSHGALAFWSPDSKRIAFFADQKLKTLTIDSGAIHVVCDAPAGRGGTWSDGGVIVFAPAAAGPLARVSAEGGDPTPVTSLDGSRGETAHRFPFFLPDGRHFLFVALQRRESRLEIFVGSIDGGDRSLITSATSGALYAPPGHLLFTRGNVLMAQPFDASARKVTGEPIALGDVPGGVNAEWLGGPAASVSQTGALSYFGGAVQSTRFVWLDPASGRETDAVEAPAGAYTRMDLSPDGRRAAVQRDDPPRADIWILDLERGGASRFTNGPARNHAPVWSPDGRRIVFVSDRSGSPELYLKDASGTTSESLLLGGALQFMDPNSWTPDGHTLVFTALDRETQQDLWLLPVDGDRKPTAYLKTPYAEMLGRVSPDGRHVLYLSTETGQAEAWVNTFPAPGEKYRVSNGGAWVADWLTDGRVAYVSGPNRDIMVADVIPGAGFRTAAPRRVGALPRDMFAGAPLPDLSRILLSVPVDRHPIASLTVVLDWAAAISRQGSKP